MKKTLVIIFAINLLTSFSTIEVAKADDLNCIGCVGSTDIINNAITTYKIATGAVRNTDIANSAITTSKIANGAVGNSDIANNAITTYKIATGAVRTTDLSNNSVTSAKLSKALRDKITDLEARIAGLESVLDSYDEVMQYVSLQTITDPNGGQEYPTLQVTGANLQIVNGSGYMHSLNGTGNLIVGYNVNYSEAFADYANCSDGQYSTSADCVGDWAFNHRSGSHNIIVGGSNNYASYGGLVAGHRNTINRRMASVSGGELNAASGIHSSVSGGILNKASGDHSSVLGGYKNTTSASLSSISGGGKNTASGAESSVSGGEHNISSGDNSSIAGGVYNTASGIHSTVSGGYRNEASGYHSSVSGGTNNTASGGNSSISGGYNDSVSGDNDWRAGDDYFSDN